jgi:hypothetical protein
MSRPKPPAKLAKGECLEVQFDRNKFESWRQVVAGVVRQDPVAGALDAPAQDRMIGELTASVGLAKEINLRSLPLVRHGSDGLPIKDDNGREIRPKLKPFKVHLFALDIMRAWESAGLDCAIYDNHNGCSALVAFATTLAHELGISKNRSLATNLRKAREYSVNSL